MTWSIYYMTLHQDVQDKVVSEIKDVLGDDEFSYAAWEKLT